jgi:DNA-binding response OmpR family regulator
MARILVIEDQAEMAELVRLMVVELGHEADVAATLTGAGALIKENRYSLVTLDIGLPDGDGFEFCAKLKAKKTFSAPVIMLTTEISAESVVRGFECGAADYLRKPIDKNELRARLRGHLREHVEEAEVFEFQGLRLDLAKRIAQFKGRRIELTGRQFDMLAYFIRRPEVVISRERMIEALGRELEIYDRTIDSHVSQLRKRLKDEGVTGISLTSVYGVGYRLE